MNAAKLVLEIKNNKWLGLITKKDSVPMLETKLLILSKKIPIKGLSFIFLVN